MDIYEIMEILDKIGFVKPYCKDKYSTQYEAGYNMRLCITQYENEPVSLLIEQKLGGNFATTGFIKIATYLSLELNGFDARIKNGENTFVIFDINHLN